MLIVFCSVNYFPFYVHTYVYVSVNCKWWCGRVVCWFQMRVLRSGSPAARLHPPFRMREGFLDYRWVSLHWRLTVQFDAAAAAPGYACLLEGWQVADPATCHHSVSVFVVCLFNGTCSSNYPSLSKRRLITASLEACYVLGQFNLVVPYPILSFPVWLLSRKFFDQMLYAYPNGSLQFAHPAVSAT